MLLGKIRQHIKEFEQLICATRQQIREFEQLISATRQQIREFEKDEGDHPDGARALARYHAPQQIRESAK